MRGIRTYFIGLAAFATRIGAYWFALVGGAGVGLLLFLWDGLGLGPLPRGLVYTICGLAIALSFFKTWQAEFLTGRETARALEVSLSRQPSLDTQIVSEHGNVYVDVRNAGAQGEVSGRLSFESEGVARDGRVQWVGDGNSDSVVLAPGARGRLKIAAHLHGGGPTSRSGGPDQVGWRVFYRYGGRPEDRTLGLRSPDNGNSGEWARIRIELISDPQLREGREVIELTSPHVE